MSKQFNFKEGEVLLIDKPLEWTSFDVVNKIRYAIAFSQKLPKRKVKVGHAGTLDPLATGLLILCTGKKTKAINEYQNMTKVYSGEMHLGYSTPSYDAETEPDATFETAHITPELIERVRQQFLGKIAQLPPIFSAVKVDGKRLYQHARKGRTSEDVKIEARPIEIFEFEITQIQMPKLRFRVSCSKGTYIRSLAHDFGKALESAAYLSSLRREAIGNFSVENAQSVEGLVAAIRAEREED